jgi:predicted metallo-beta-lactamase superfamily hydrolase
MKTFHVFNKSVVVSIDSKTFVIGEDDPRYGKVLEVIVDNDLDQLQNAADTDAIDEIRALLKLNRKDI